MLEELLEILLAFDEALETFEVSLLVFEEDVGLKDEGFLICKLIASM